MGGTTLVIGAGPGGLAAALELAKSCAKPIVLEKDDVVGGNMRSVRRGGFTVDVGRKELYDRIPVVDKLWTDLLKDDYIPYERRVGVLHAGRIYEVSSRFRGARRGMTWGVFSRGCVDFLANAAFSTFKRPQNYENFMHLTRGQTFARIFSQGFEEKFQLIKWSDLPAPEGENRLTASMLRLWNLSNKGRGAEYWRHPAEGTGQVCEIMRRQIEALGGVIRLSSSISDIEISDNLIRSVSTIENQKTVRYHPANVVANIPPDTLWNLLRNGGYCGLDIEPPMACKPQKLTILVYLFLDEPSRFPHTWLNVSCPRCIAGRITNYAAFGGRMVPREKSCLCIEYFCDHSDPIVALSQEHLVAMAVDECCAAGLIERDKCYDNLVIKAPIVDPAESWRDWHRQRNQFFWEAFKKIDNLYFVSRAGTDVSSYAGMIAANSIASDQKHNFHLMADPAKKVDDVVRDAPLSANAVPHF